MDETDRKKLFYTVSEAAIELGVTKRRITAMIANGSLKAVRAGIAFLITPADLDAVRNRPKGRRPWHDDWVKANPEKAKAQATKRKEKERRRKARERLKKGRDE